MHFMHFTNTHTLTQAGVRHNKKQKTSIKCMLVLFISFFAIVLKYIYVCEYALKYTSQPVVGKENVWDTK